MSPRVAKPVSTAAAACLVAIVGCGSWQRVGSGTGPDPTVVLPQLFDPTGLYAGMGFFARGMPLPFVAHLRFLATQTTDSTLAVFAMSLANNALSFRRAADGFEARYRAELVLRRDGAVTHRAASEETVRVATRDEAVRADESVIFQQVFRVPPGDYAAVVTVRDEHTGSQSRHERPVRVPRFLGRGLSDLLPVYEIAERASLDASSS